MNKRMILGIAAYLIALAPVVSCVCGAEGGSSPAVRKPPPPRRQVAVIAHRGGAAIAPENTLAAFRKAIELGADFVEIDTRQTRDGAIVLMHDSKVDRTTDGRGAVRDLTLEQIRKLDAGSKFSPQFAGERVPTLQEAAELCKGKIGIYLDHKDGDIATICAILEKCGIAENVVVYDGVEELRQFRKHSASVILMPSLQRRYMRAGGVSEFLKIIDAGVLEGSLNEWNKVLVDEAHAHGRLVFLDCLGISDNPAGYKQALEMGVDGIQTDRPDVLIKMLDEMAGK